MFTAFINGIILTGEETIEGSALLIEDKQIRSVTDPRSLPPGIRIIDCNGNFIAPGLIDLQIAGGGGYLFSETPTPAAMKAIADAIVRTGTTGFLIAIPTNTFEVYNKVTSVAAENPMPAVLGFHFEGPYISPQRRGAHFLSCIRKPDRDELDSLLKDAGGTIRMMTVAPEVCTRDIIECLNNHGVIAAAGHSNATFSEAVEGFGWGIRTTTHLFNAMSQLHHRDPGLPGAAFETDNIMASIIADGIHVDYNMVSIAKKIMKERLFLVSDAVEESSQGTNPHRRQKDRFTLPDGTLSGSVLSMLTAVRNCVRHVGIEMDEALRMASLYPARLMGLSDRGKIAAGFRADLVLFDSDFNVSTVVTDGEVIEINNL
jgi:N-acetylglucosamine-6-phosphate deacetylase